MEMNAPLSSLSTESLLCLGDELNVHGQSNADWDLFDAVVYQLKQRSDLHELPYWLFD